MWKKVIAILCIICLMFVLTACGTSEADIGSDEEAAEAAGEIADELTELTEELEELNEDLG